MLCRSYFATTINSSTQLSFMTASPHSSPTYDAELTTCLLALEGPSRLTPSVVSTRLWPIRKATSDESHLEVCYIPPTPHQTLVAYLNTQYAGIITLNARDARSLSSVSTVSTRSPTFWPICSKHHPFVNTRSICASTPSLARTADALSSPLVEHLRKTSMSKNSEASK